MPNSQVFRGNNATLQLPVFIALGDRGAELGGSVQTEYGLGAGAGVGRLTGIEIRVDTDLETFHEIGTRKPVSLVPGNINISGRVDRAYINGALLRMLMGRVAGSGQNEDAFPLELQPSFAMIVNLVNIRSNSGTAGTKLNVSGVRFDDWVVKVPEDDFVMENATFRALSIEREEVEDTTP